MRLSTASFVISILAGWLQLLLVYLFGLDVRLAIGYAVGVTISFIIACYLAED
jgi:hypothetical protein